MIDRESETSKIEVYETARTEGKHNNNWNIQLKILGIAIT